MRLNLSKTEAMPFKDITGTPEAPSCPKHKSVALMIENRPPVRNAVAIWRCPVDNKVYIETPSL